MRPGRGGVLRGLLLALCGVVALGGCTKLGPSGAGAPVQFAPPAATAAVERCGLVRRAVVDLNLRGLILVAARINGAPATLALDTGAERSVLTEAAAKRLAVTTRYDFARPIRGIGRTIATGDARLRSLSLGGHSLAHPRILVGGLVLPSHEGVEADGLLGADLLADFDLDLDLPGRRLTLYDRMDCTRLRPPWPGRYATITTTRSLDRHPFFPVLLDGQAVDATIDSGAQRTVLGARAAARLGVTAAQLAQDPVVLTQGVGAEVLQAYAHPFGTMVIGAERISRPVVVVVDAAMPRAADMVVGIDYLLSRRIWLSYGSRRIFVSRPE